MLPLEAGDVHVWYVAPEQVAAPQRADAYEALLSTEERARNRRFVFPADRHRDLVARVLVRATLSRYAPVEPRDWTFRTGRYGRPKIVDMRGAPPLRFSLSHTHGLVALAVTLDADVGLDTERLDERPFDLDLARRYFALSEVADLASLPRHRQPRAFLEYWTLKEAYVKATGFGLSLPLDSFSMRLTQPPTISFTQRSHEPASDWHFAQPALSASHVVALAIRHPAGAPTVATCEAGLDEALPHAGFDPTVM